MSNGIKFIFLLFGPRSRRLDSPVAFSKIIVTDLINEFILMVFVGQPLTLNKSANNLLNLINFVSLVSWNDVVVQDINKPAQFLHKTLY